MIHPILYGYAQILKSVCLPKVHRLYQLGVKKEYYLSKLCPFTFGIFFHHRTSCTYRLLSRKNVFNLHLVGIEAEKDPLQSPCSHFTSRIPLLSTTT